MTALGQYIVRNGEGFSVENFTYLNSRAYAAVTFLGPQAIFALNRLSGKVEPLTGLQEIKSALASYYASKGSDPEAFRKLEAVHNGFLAIKDNRKSGEAECKRLLGTDRNTCDSFESCRYSCFSITSFCQNFMYGGAPGEFINIMWDFENRTRDLDAAYKNESLVYAAMGGNISGTMAANESKAIGAYLSSIGGINRAATRVSTSALFYGYSFCFTPDYSLPAITTLQLLAQNAYRQGLPFLSLDENSRGIQNRTLDGIARKLRYDAALEAARVAAEKKKNESLNQSNATAIKNETPNQGGQPPSTGESRESIPQGTLAIFASAVAFAALAVAFYVVKMRGKPHKAKFEAFGKAEKDIRKGKR